MSKNKTKQKQPFDSIREKYRLYKKLDTDELTKLEFQREIDKILDKLT